MNQEYLTCRICNLTFKTNYLLSSHIRHIHKLKYKDYYDQYLKKPGEGFCIVCGKEIPWDITYKSNGSHYKTYCSSDCTFKSPLWQQHREETNLQRYGMRIIAQLPSVRQKIALSTSISNSSKTPEEKIQILSKRKQTNVKKFGVEFPTQNKQLLGKCITNQYKQKEYMLPSGKKIMLQGFEPQFLDYIFNNTTLTENDVVCYPDSFTYLDSNNNSHYYYPDFLIPKLNLIIEIKSRWTVKTDKNLLLKEQIVKSEGFNYLRIIDNNFTEFNQALKT